MDKHTHVTSLKYILSPLICLVLITGMMSISPNRVHGQHQIPPETWIEMRKMSRPKGPAPTIAEDIAALAGADAKRAGPRLIDHGPEALPAVHAALQSSGVEPLHAQRLLQVLRAIGDKSSVPVVLELIKKDTQDLLRRDAFLALVYLPATEESAALMTDVTANEAEAWNTRRVAFAWFGLHRDSRGRPFAEILRTDPDPEKRTAGLYVLSRLGDKTVLEPISQMLAAGPPANSRDGLMLALAEVTTPEEFERRAPASLAWSHGYKDSLLYTRYIAAGPEEKISLCREMLRAQRPEHMALAVRCLLEKGHADDLRPMAALDLEAPGRDALIRNEIRRAGWRIIDTDDEFTIVPIPAAQ